MKITLSNTPKNNKRTVNGIFQSIVDKLNSLTTKGFFAWLEYDYSIRTTTTSFANVKRHNRVVILLALFTDSQNNRYGTYTNFADSGIHFCGFNTVERLEALEAFVDSIDLEKSEIVLG